MLFTISIKDNYILCYIIVLIKLLFFIIQIIQIIVIFKLINIKLQYIPQSSETKICDINL
jgi:hypothetical protein